MKKSVFDYLVFTAAACYIAGQAFALGDVWDLRSNPAHGVDVEVPGGRVYHGALQQDWNGNFELTLPDGDSVRFSDNPSLVIRRTVDSSGSGQGVLAHWRSWLAGYAVIILYMAWVIHTFVQPSLCLPGGLPLHSLSGLHDGQGRGTSRSRKTLCCLTQPAAGCDRAVVGFAS